MFALPISKPRFKSIIFFYQNSPKMKLFLQKNAKFLSAGAPPPEPYTPNTQLFPRCEFLATRLSVARIFDWGGGKPQITCSRQKPSKEEFFVRAKVS